MVEKRNLSTLLLNVTADAWRNSVICKNRNKYSMVLLPFCKRPRTIIFFSLSLNKICFTKFIIGAMIFVLKTQSRVFICSRILSFWQSFHQVMNVRRTCFTSYIKLLFSDLTKKITIYEARMLSFISFMKQ